MKPLDVAGSFGNEFLLMYDILTLLFQEYLAIFSEVLTKYLAQEGILGEDE